MTILDKLESDFGKPLPKKPKRKGESEFQHKIRQWTEEVKDRPGRFPGGQDQAIAIAAEQAGVSKTVELDDDEMNDTRKAIDILKGLGGSFTSGVGTGQAVGAGMDTPGGSVAPLAGVATRTAGSAIDKLSPNKPASPTAKACKACKNNDCPDHMNGREELDKDMVEYASLNRGIHGSSAPMMMSNEEPDEEAKKAMHSRSLAIPFWQRNPNYDPNDVYRSATTQTSRQYTSLAPLVRETVEDAKAGENAIERNEKRVAKASDHVRKIREEQAKAANTPRTSMRFVW